MKIYFAPACLLISFFSFGQNISRDCRKGNPRCNIHYAAAHNRIEIYLNHKFKCIPDNCGTKFLNCHPQNFLKLLRDHIAVKNPQTNDSSNLYDGLRIYYAVDKDVNKLSIIFVPTKADSKNFGTHDDDTTNCWVIKNDTIQYLPSKTAVKWKKNFDDSLLRRFQEDGQKQLNKYIKKYNKSIDSYNKNPKHKHKQKLKHKVFIETESLWYDMKYIDNSRGNSLICFMNKNPSIDSVKICFAGYPKVTYPLNFQFRYHLTLIFAFHSSIKINGKRHNYTYKFNLLTSSASGEKTTDTADPCPPYPGGSPPCPGTRL